tara:strand:- start:314 stop:742 length:429 start_codon:yes stop_codon:yes gene_type:complete
MEGKVWGMTQKFLDNPFCSFHVLKINKGGVCSQHLHHHRWNGFYIISGSLKINRWATANQIDSTILKEGQWTACPPGEYHQFEALTDTHAIEIYWPSACTQKDIKRKTQGFLNTPPSEPTTRTKTQPTTQEEYNTLWNRSYC